MKKISIFLSVIFLVLIKAQTVSDYKYILIPQEFNDFKDNKDYGLGIIMEKSLKGKKYVVLSETKTSWPAEALTNPCKVLATDVLNDKSMFRNKIILNFKDCNNQVVFTEKGSSTIKEFEPGFQDALKQGLAKVPISNPSATIEKIAESKPVEEIKKVDDVKVAQSPAAQKYKNGSLSLQRIQIDNSQFILVDGNSSVPFATFRATTKQDVFRVKLASGVSTIGYYENGNIVIEIPKNNDEFSKEVFSVN
ncbi:hypothetical protein [Epilithonimonas hispanica]|uniref:Uncharacterized protein n=1 Tax=Epilithonimonas hispanica TaxID=358687 RepID=A0A3D9D2A5_9FLAO|nr:hypothetical protein [Epilithonimonas hispanica]REC72140.1 hypothetical protein DRF58_04110 [Epilithonimonas hispanica]